MISARFTDDGGHFSAGQPVAGQITATPYDAVGQVAPTQAGGKDFGSLKTAVPGQGRYVEIAVDF
jgi:hypothetical protein